MNDSFFNLRPLSTWFATTSVEAMEVLRLSVVDDVDSLSAGTESRFGRHGFRRVWTHAHTLTKGERDRCLELVSALPPSEVARCHEPGFGLRVNPGPAEAQVTLCFECDNAYADEELLSFDANSPAATALLAFLRSLEYSR